MALITIAAKLPAEKRFKFFHLPVADTRGLGKQIEDLVDHLTGRPDYSGRWQIKIEGEEDNG